GNGAAAARRMMSARADHGADRAFSRALPARLADRLARAARGKPADFRDIPTPRASPFKRRCWDAARRIPRGETISYGELARRAGSPGAARAAGQAMRTNPLPLIVPCHRVVASNGLGGYAGTMDRSDARCRTKLGLLELERARSSPNGGARRSARRSASLE
ncbi:MAG: methylated-DNA--[protein]-cysteine S-methyltransferase, partial [Phycisphaerae bacterium]|nr:methylated-DNA--[protein]-cysteine S-methyltransferase [Phycisphaerae bacterium]